MASDEIHVDDVGTLFIITIYDGDDVVDISAATTKQIKFRKSDGTTLTKTATFLTDGSDGKLDYTTVAEDLDVSGSWEIQAFVETPTGNWHSDKGYFEVLPNVN